MCNVACETGRSLGCGTYCCRLLVRITEAESKALFPGKPVARFIEKAEDGFCRFLDRETHRCSVWENRPQVCRDYDCNDDFLLQVAICEGSQSLVQLATRARTLYRPRECWIRVPSGSSGNSREEQSSNHARDRLADRKEPVAR